MTLYIVFNINGPRVVFEYREQAEAYIADVTRKWPMLAPYRIVEYVPKG